MQLFAPSKLTALIGNGWRAHKEHQPECDSACTPRVFADRTVNRLLVSAVEEVVGGVGHQLSLAYRAGGRRNSSSSSIQALNKRGFEQEVPACGPFFVPYGL